MRRPRSAFQFGLQEGFLELDVVCGDDRAVQFRHDIAAHVDERRSTIEHGA